MKKILTMILAMLMILALAACGESAPAPVQMPQTNNTTAAPTTEATEAETAPVETAAPETEPVETTAPVESAETAEILGVVNGTVYSNNALGLSIDLPAEYVYSTYEEILASNQLAETATAEEINAMSSLMTMMAINNGTGSSINVMVEQGTEEAVQSFDLAASFAEQEAGIKAAYEQLGYTEVATGCGQVEIDGTVVDALVIQAKLNGQDCAALSFGYKHGNKIVYVSLTAMNEADAEVLTNAITLH